VQQNVKHLVGIYLKLQKCERLGVRRFTRMKRIHERKQREELGVVAADATSFAFRIVVSGEIKKRKKDLTSFCI
jgi:hypothetical protein